MSGNNTPDQAQHQDAYETDNTPGPQQSEGDNESSNLPNHDPLHPLAVQMACQEVIQRLNSNPVLAQHAWGSALITAPAAISVMAVCLKAAAERQAAGIRVQNVTIKDPITGDIVGTLPSDYLYSNLQHCNDIGRHAFVDAQNRMSYLNSIARGMVGEDGNLGYIVELLENPEDAKHDLKPEIDRIKAAATLCLQSAQGLGRNVWYWNLVMCHLKTSVQTLNGKIGEEKENMARKKDEATELQEGWKLEEMIAEGGITTLNNQLSEAQKAVSNAREELERLQGEEPPAKSAALDDLDMACEAFPHIEDSKKSRQIAINWVINKQRSHFIAQAGAERLEQQSQAMKKLDEAREDERRCFRVVETARSRYLEKNYNLLRAKAGIGRIARELNRLGSRKTELDDIIRILENSTRELSQMKTYLDQLLTLFQAIVGLVEDTIMNHLENFLGPITRRSEKHRGRTVNRKLSTLAKRKILSAALQIQGQFSAIADISHAYVDVSSRYIRPAINKMEMLGGTSTNDPEWPALCEEFQNWCHDAASGIEHMVKETGEKMQENLRTEVTKLQRRAIEATEMGDE
ncbi:hypothetical protein P154DRAFT_618630 [Amniculicola lignicola CBS 123094]|uniref:Uncharacterized protein n=1 Tax=Amniculicola lignicola CBS 123094 TaxID=1392246 RepID=A0A6A5WKJ5_9PLEO|nr:hypothetical protein P154DRAFT_618630 [Amniculicola lignicola CBS 123094]